MPFRVCKGRKMNRFLCLFLLIFALIFLIAAGVFALAGNAAAAYTFCILALIVGGFSAFYGLFWFLFGRSEKKTEEKLREILEEGPAADDPGRPEYREFILPKAELIEKAGKRLRGVVRWTGIAALGVFVLTGGIQLLYGSLKSPVQLLYMLLFCVLIMIPGILIQLRLYREYDRSVPARILLFPGKLVIDDLSLSAREIREIRLSPARVYNRHSPDVFREMQIRTDKSSTTYRIDYRAGTPDNEQAFWPEYEQFVAALSAWGESNGVPVTVSYMA